MLRSVGPAGWELGMGGDREPGCSHFALCSDGTTENRTLGGRTCRPLCGL